MSFLNNFVKSGKSLYTNLNNKGDISTFAIRNRLFQLIVDLSDQTVRIFGELVDSQILSENRYRFLSRDAPELNRNQRSQTFRRGRICQVNFLVTITKLLESLFRSENCIWNLCELRCLKKRLMIEPYQINLILLVVSIHDYYSKYTNQKSVISIYYQRKQNYLIRSAFREHNTPTKIYYVSYLYEEC